MFRLQMDAVGLEYQYLDGGTRDRPERVARFQSDDGCGLFLISLKAGGTRAESHLGGQCVPARSMVESGR